MPKENKIVWVASYPKCGSTWVRLFLDAYFLESVDLNDIATSFSDIRLNNSTYELANEGISKQIPYKNEMLEQTIKAHNELNTEIPLFIKTHSGNYIIDGHEAIPPKLTKSVIYLVRHPKEILPSFAKHVGRSVDDTIKLMKTKNMCMNDPGVMETYLSTWATHVESYLDADTLDVCVVKYEDLKENPIKEFTRILKASGVEPDVDRVKKAIELTELSKLQKIEKKKGFKEASKYQEAGFFGKKNGTITLKQLNKLTTAFKPEIRRLGYFKRVA